MHTKEKQIQKHRLNEVAERTMKVGDAPAASAPVAPTALQLVRRDRTSPSPLFLPAGLAQPKEDIELQ